MNAIPKQFLTTHTEKSARARVERRGSVHRYDSPEQERLAKYVLQKHYRALRELAK